MGSKTREPYDVLVVGSGASGGWAAKRMAEAGARVALVDAGRPLRITDLDEHGSTFDLPYRGVAPEVVRRTRPTQGTHISVPDPIPHRRPAPEQETKARDRHWPRA